MGCPTTLRRTPFSSAARKSLPGATTKDFLSGLVSCARTRLAAKHKTEQENKIHTTLGFILSLISYQISGAFQRKRPTQRSRNCARDYLDQMRSAARICRRYVRN